ncbi:MAG: lamin tail domain-containing protein [Ignavibacteria bacterium]|nr:lamin tail domain-containing protein [Ignavibacteria bacterium]
MPPPSVNPVPLLVDASPWIELYNSESTEVNLAGYSLTDQTWQPRKWVFPSNMTIAPQGYLVLLCDEANYIGNFTVVLAPLGKCFISHDGIF